MAFYLKVKIYCSIILALFCQLNRINAQTYVTLDQVLADREQDVMKVAALAEKLYAARCERCKQQSGSGNQLSCSIHFCSNQGLGQTCQNNFVKQSCRQDCPNNGEMVNAQASAIQTPIEKTILSESENSIICGMSGNGTGSLDRLFVDIYNEHIGDIASMFVGFNEGGIFKRFPINSLDCTVNYDPRFRPWFVAGSSGAKNVIIVLDKSGSMRTNDRIGVTKSAAIMVLQTLTIADWFGIVTFDSVASQYQPYLTRATSAQIVSATFWINSIQEGGGTNFYAGLDLAYRLFSASHNDEYGTACQSMILFMTDGKVENPENQDTWLIQNLTSIWDPKNQVTIFSYSVGSDADDFIPKHLACHSNGVWTKIEDSQIGDLRQAMSQYYAFIAFGLQITKVAWTEPYASTFGVGQMVSASFPIYDRTSDPIAMVGVAGVTILMDSLNQYEGDSSVILKKLISRSSNCFTNNLTFCQMEDLRLNDAQKCGIATNLTVNTNTNITNQTNSTSQSTNTTCPPTNLTKGCLNQNTASAICGAIIGGQKPNVDTCCGDCLSYLAAQKLLNANILTTLVLSLIFICSIQIQLY